MRVSSRCADVTSDCDADNDVIFSHHFKDHSPAEGVADVLKAGTDVDCGGFVGKYAQAALDNKTITESDIDERLSKLFRVRMRMDHFDPLGPLQVRDPLGSKTNRSPCDSIIGHSISI